MSSRPPGKLIVLPSAQRYWQRQRLRKRRVKLAVASVGLLGLLAAGLDVVFDSGAVPPTEAAADEGTSDTPPRPAAGRVSREPDTAPAWLSTTGSE